jgi:hypothetical protein
MTFRPPASKPTRRRSRQQDSRRAIYFNIAFGLSALAALVLLGGVVLGNYYTDHGAPVASVNGVAVSKDAVRARASVNTARSNRLLSNYDILRNQGKMTTVEASTLSSAVPTDQSTIYTNSMNELTQGLTFQQYADKHGISASDADVEAQLVKDATIPEMRHVKVIAVDPTTTPPNSIPTVADNDAAKALAQSYLDSIQTGGKKWDDVYKTSTTGVTTPSGSGDQGLITRDSGNLDPALVDAVFNLQKVNDITPVMRGTDGTYRFATVTSILLPYVDQGWEAAVSSASNGDELHRAAKTEALQAKIRAGVEAQYVTGPSTARHLQEIVVSSGYGQQGGGDEVRSRMIVFAPNHDTSKAASLDPNGPEWADAKNRANAAWQTLNKDITQFTTIASDTKQNDDAYLASVGGQFPWLPNSVFTGNAQQQQGLGMSAVPAAIFNPSIKLGLQTPIQEPTMGWIIVDFQGSRPAPSQRIADVQLLLATGGDFATVAQKYSEAPDANYGADLGWVYKWQLQPDLEDAIVQAPVGGLSRVVEVSDGWHLYKVLAEETRTPSASEQLTLKATVWNGWLAALNKQSNVWTDTAGLQAITPTATP